MNKELLLKVKQHILTEPNRLIMGYWLNRAKPGSVVTDYGSKVRVPECGTVACIAGWTCLLAEGMDYAGGNIQRKAADLLGLEYVPTELFYTDEWPDGDGEEFELEMDPRRRAQLAATQIDEFIENTVSLDGVTGPV